MPFTHPAVWDDHIADCPLCTSPDRDEQALLRCTVHTLLTHGAFRTADDIPFAEITVGGDDYLRSLANSPGGDCATPVPDPRQGTQVDAEVRLALARAAGLDPAGTLDPRIDRVPATWPEAKRADLFDRAADLFARRHTPAPDRRFLPRPAPRPQ
ncbi:hypothetical protein ACIBCM_32100 [Streptomyces sp. NPDC051018]|uniref:hypothetical protein n=1 Tax=Streptomyces sp. NPDC051018 TaxID=3365639 RepID=UPI003793E6BE